MSLFEKIKDGVEKMIGDVTTLDVATFTGDIEVSNAKEGTDLKLKQLWTNLQKDADLQAKLKVVAFTHIDADHDTLNFLTNDRDIDFDQLYAAHTKAVKTAQEARKAILEMGLTIFKPK